MNFLFRRKVVVLRYSSFFLHGAFLNISFALQQLIKTANLFNCWI